MWILNICTSASISKNWQPTYTEALMINFKKWVLILHFKKNIVKIKNRLSILNVFVFFINVKVNQGIPPFLGNSHFSSTLLFLEKIFHCHFYCQINEVNPLLYKMFEQHNCNIKKLSLCILSPLLFICWQRELNFELCLLPIPTKFINKIKFFLKLNSKQI